MATKPSSILGYNPSRSACVTIPSGKMAAGFLPGEKPPAQYLGDIFERVDRWLEYVKDGAWTGNTTIAGTLGVTGNTSITGTLSASGLITASAGVAAAANQHVTVSGTGRLKHGDDFVALSASDFNAPASGQQLVTTSYGAQWVFAITGGGSGGPSATPKLPAGCRIKTVEFFFDKNGQPNGMAFGVSKANMLTGTVTPISSASDSTSLFSRKSVTLSPAYQIEPGFFVEIFVDQGRSGTGTTTSFFGVNVTFDRP